MASFLDTPVRSQSQQIFLFGESFDSESDDSSEPVTIWVKDKDIIQPSANLVLMQKLEPGIYTVHVDRENGLYCKKNNLVSDELFLFSDSITTQLLNEINLFWSKKDLYKENKLIHKRGILLEGFPGTGKSSIISILSNNIISQGGVVFRVSGPGNLSYYIDFILGSFRKIQPDTPVITILEDLDHYEDVEDDILDFLDGKSHINHHVVIATTNNTEDIPDTFLRPSRIDLRIEVPMPCEKTRKEYFEYKNVPKEDIDNLVDRTEKLSLADLKEIYICIYLLGYSCEDALLKVSSPRDKRNYSKSPGNKISLAI